MEELGKQVKGEMLRTLIWSLIAFGVAMGLFYVL